MFDWMEQLLTPCPRHLRDLGYFRELLNIRACFRWWQSAWQPHLERTQQVILRGIERCPRRRKAVILGSGLLYDVPLVQLSAAFEQVVLVDLLHPFGTRRKIRHYRNVCTLAADISGVAKEVHAVAGRADAPLPRAAPRLFCDDADVDFVASVNLLSQLPCMPAGYLRRAGVHAEKAIDDFAGDLIGAHLTYLQQLPGVVTLIADYEALTLNRAGDMLKQTSTVYDVPLPWQPSEEWIWRLVPLARRPPYHSEWLKVAAIVNIHETVKKLGFLAPGLGAGGSRQE